MSDVSPSQALNNLRTALDEVDAKLVQLAAERQRLVSNIGAIKAQDGRQLRDFRRERAVLDSVRAQAKSLSLDPDLAEDLIARLIEASLTRQEQEQVKRAHRGEGLQALVIGGAGRLGAWLVSFMDAQGYEVTVADTALENQPQFRQFTDWREAGVDFDVIVLATPPRVTAELLDALIKHKPSGLVFDVGSIKSPLIASLREAAEADLKICSVHPMFGPSTTLLSGRHVLLMDVGSRAAVEQAKGLFMDTMAKTVELPIEAHDRLMAFVLGLSHALNIAFVTALVDTGVTAEELSQISSTTFERQLAIARDVINESPAVYYEIQKLNEHGELARESLARALALIQSAVMADEPGDFTELMARGQAFVQSLSTD